MRPFITIFLLLITLPGYGQSRNSKWTFYLNYQNDLYRDVNGAEVPKSDGVYAFRGWSAGVDRTIIQKKYLKLNAGIGLNSKTQVLTRSPRNAPFAGEQLRGLNYYYLTTPFTLKFTKNKKIQPSISLTSGFQVFNQREINEVTRFHRPPVHNFIQIMPGAEISISERIKIFVGIGLTRYDFFTKNQGKWGGGFQIGLKINIKHRKRSD